MGSPRNFAEWIQLVERNQVALRGIAGSVQAVVNQTVANGSALQHQPTAPIELVYQTALYTDPRGRTRARFILDFPDVVKATDGTDVVADGYELWGQDVSLTVLDKSTSAVPAVAVPGLTLPGLAATTTALAQEAALKKPAALVATSATSAFRVDDFTPGTLWTFQVRAIAHTSTVPGVFSDPVTVQMLTDDTPPPQLTKPTVTASRGVISVAWDGFAVTGGLPADFKYAILAGGPASSPTTEIARFGPGGGFTVDTGMPYYTPMFYRLQAVDESGNHGPWSEEGTGYTTPLVDTDIILSEIDGARTYLKNIDAGVAILPNSIITKNLYVTEDMTAALAQFLTVKAGMLDANQIWADSAWFGVADAKLVRADMFVGKEFSGGTFTGPLIQTGEAAYDGVKISPTGVLGYSPSGVETFRLDAADGSLTATYGTLTGLTYQSHAAANTGIKISDTGLKLYDLSNRLAVNLALTGATFTGTVTSGFGTVNAAVTDDAGRGRPGLRLAVNTTSYWQPQVLGASGQDGWANGTLMAVSSRNGGTNSDYYGMLALGNGGAGWYLGSTNGAGGNLQAITAFGDLDTLKLQGGTGVVQMSSSAVYMNSNGTVMQVESNGTATISTSGGTTIYGGLSVSGSKNFVMDHPTLAGKELLHGSTESPVSGIEYWGEAVVGADGTCVVALPDYFEALAKPGNRAVLVSGQGACLDWTDIVDGTFTVSGTAGVKFGWLVKAERIGGDFPVIRDKVVPPDTTITPV